MAAAEIPDAQTDEAPEGPASMFDAMPPLVIGEPFAIAEGLDFLEAPARNPNAPPNPVHPGCVAIVQCKGPEGRACGQIFRIDLLAAGVKFCPKCQQRYSHVLLVAPEKDDDVIASAMAVVLRSNGFNVPDDDAEDDEDDDDEGDEPER